MPLAEVFLLLPALLAAWLAQSLHLLRQLRNLRPDAEAIAGLRDAVEALRSQLATLATTLERQAKNPDAGRE